MSADIDPAAIEFARVLPPAEALAIAELLRKHREGDVVTALKARVTGGTALFASEADRAVVLVRMAYPDSYRLTRAQVRALRRTITRVNH